MTENVDWELKDRRIAWQSITKGLCEVQAALISSGCKKFENLKDAMKDINDARLIEMALFIGIDSGEGFLSAASKTGDPKNYICEKCNAKITEGVSNWSLKEYNRALCMKCQGKEKK